MKPLATRKPRLLANGKRAQRSFSLGRWLAFLAAVAVIASSTLAWAQAGQLDSTFGTGGIFTTNYTSPDQTMDNSVAIQSDGKIIVGGSNPGGAVLMRLNTNGTLDSTFGTGGVVNNSAVLGPVMALAIQPDGKILAFAAGFTGASLGRFNTDGSVDTTFGSDGFAVSKSLNSGPGILSVMALQADGKILVTGAGLVGRYTSTGQLDTSFGNGGSGIAALNATIATGIAVQPDGKILVTTGTAAPSELLASPGFPSPQAGAIARYNTNGSLDTTFGISGQASCVASAAGIAIQSNGKIVVAGTIPSVLSTLLESDGITVANNQAGFGLVRYNANGSVDTSFNPGGGIGSGGGVITGFGNSFPQASGFSLAIQSNGEIVVAGQAGNGNNGYSSSSFVLARYTTSGHLDTNFGSDGIVMTPIGQGHISFVSALVLQSDGKIVAAGNYAPPAGGDYVNNFAVARYLAQ
jgi:uncharacterized delta-60 repeat protein